MSLMFASNKLFITVLLVVNGHLLWPFAIKFVKQTSTLSVIFRLEQEINHDAFHYQLYVITLLKKKEITI